MDRFLETIRFVEVVTQEDVDIARLTDNQVKPTEVTGLYTVDLEDISDFNEIFTEDGKTATLITLKTGHQRSVKMRYKELKTKHTAYFDRKDASVRDFYNDLKPLKSNP